MMKAKWPEVINVVKHRAEKVLGAAATCILVSGRRRLGQTHTSLPVTVTSLSGILRCERWERTWQAWATLDGADPTTNQNF
jgi:hypothetical protein